MTFEMMRGRCRLQGMLTLSKMLSSGRMMPALLAEPLQEIVGDEGSIGEEVHSQDAACREEPNWGLCICRGKCRGWNCGIAVEEVAHHLVKVAITVFCGGQERRRLAIEGTEGTGYSVDEMGQG